MSTYSGIPMTRVHYANVTSGTSVYTFSGDGIFIGHFNGSIRIVSSGKYWNDPTRITTLISNLAQTFSGVGSITSNATTMTATFDGNGAFFTVHRISF